GGLGLALVLAGGLYGPISGLFAREDRGVIGSGPFTEQHILSELLARKLKAAGFHADQRKSMSEGIPFLALQSGQIDCMVNYSGNVWTLLMKRKEFADQQTVLAEVTRYLRDEHGIVCLGSLGFENAYALAMPRARAEKLGIHSIADLAKHAKGWKIASDSQFFGRPEWFKVRDSYGLQFKQQVPMDPTLMYGAVNDG